MNNCILFDLKYLRDFIIDLFLTHKKIKVILFEENPQQKLHYASDEK